MDYRKDIDGLRSLAIVPVVLFHAGVPGFSGGYVGVDIFFVISGFLITSILQKDLHGGVYSIAKFYDRRIRRIFPALLFMIATVTIAAMAVLLPSEMAVFARTLFSVSTFASNMYFIISANYFSPDAEVNPFLHTWSLAVEEQFYIFFPILLAVMHRYGMNKLAVIGGICALSLIFSEALPPFLTSVNFYSLPTRAWELGLGALLALTPVVAGQPRSRISEAAGALGIALIVASVLLYTSTTPFPGIAALAPCLGAALLIWAGRSGSAASTLLGWRPLREIGLVSYSWYLWHWPALVLPAIYLMRPLTAVEAGLAVIGSFLLAVFSRRIVEQPFLKRGHAAPRVSLLAGGGALLLLIGVSALLWNGAPWRVPPAVAAMDANGVRPVSSLCAFDDGACRQAGRPTVVLFGDSHAGQYAAAIEGAGDGAQVVEAVATGCAPMTGAATDDPHRQQCRQWARDTANAIARDADVATVVLAGRWSRYFLNPANPEYLSLGEPTERAIRSGLAAVITTLRQGGKQVVVIGPSPTAELPLPACLARTAWQGGDGRACAFHPQSLPGGAPERLVRSVAQQAGVRYVDVYATLCPRGRCPNSYNGTPLLWDTDHLSRGAAAAVWDGISITR